LKLTFLGATGTVTGSRYLIEDDGKRYLVDCGLFQGMKDDRLRNWQPFPVPPASISAIVLTHAHIDHSGYIPRMIRDGFKGPVYCSQATRDLCAILLPDSGFLQEEDAANALRHGFSKHTPPLPLYTKEEGEAALAYFRPVPWGRRHTLGKFLGFSLFRAGHILGAASVRIDDGATSLLFSGDLGRHNDPVMVAPSVAQGADYLVVESTYGDRRHDAADPATELADVINRTVSRGGSIVAPAFAVGRAQLLLFYLHRLKSEGRIPSNLPVFLDSPMAIDVSELLHIHPNDHRLSPELARAVCSTAIYTRSREESRRLDDSTVNMPAFIISASGMATGGRVLHHLKRFMGGQKNTILLAGFQAAGTRGARFAAGEKEIKIHGALHKVEAEVVKLDNMSAHADSQGIIEWIGAIPGAPKRIFVTHGEPVAAEALKARLNKELQLDATVPRLMDSFDL
jgi:metallo-beta-lactamase family protein